MVSHRFALAAAVALAMSTGCASTPRYGTTTTTYLVSATPAPDKDVAKMKVARTVDASGTKLSLTLVLGGKSVPRGTVEYDARGRLKAFDSTKFPGMRFERGADQFGWKGKTPSRLKHRRRLVAPDGAVVFKQKDLMGLVVLARRFAAPWEGLRSFSYISPDTLSLTVGWAASAGTETLSVDGKPMRVRKVLVFSPGGGALLFIDEGGRLLRAEVPLEGIWLRVEGSEQLAIAPRKPATGYVEKDVTVKHGAITLAGTLSTPREGSGKLPAVLCLSGSGAQDRNSDGPGLPLRIFSALADALTPLGVVVLRYDDRGAGRSTGSHYKASTTDLINDAGAMLKFLAAHPRVDPARITLLGHSEGTMHAAKLVAKMPDKVAGIISLGTMGLTPGATFWSQNMLIGEGGPEEPLARLGMASKVLEAVSVNRPMAETLAVEIGEFPELKKLLAMESQTKERLSFDGNAMWGAIKVPMLLVTGGLDGQVPPDHAIYAARATRKAGNKDVEVRILPDLDHTFRKAWLGYMGEYADRYRPLHPSLVATVRDYVKKRISK